MLDDNCGVGLAWPLIVDSGINVIERRTWYRSHFYRLGMSRVLMPAPFEAFVGGCVA